MQRNFPQLTIVHEGELPPEQFEVEIPERATTVLARRLKEDDRDEIQRGVEESESLLRPWLTWHDNNGDRSSWSRVAATVADEFVTANWWSNRHWFNWMLYNTATDEFIGMIDTGPKGAGTFEMGYWTTSSSNARGVMSRVTGALAQIDFDVLGAQRIVFEINDANQASKRIAYELGATLDHEIDETPLIDTMRVTKNIALMVDRSSVRFKA